MLSRQLLGNATATRVLLSGLARLMKRPWRALLVAAIVSGACIWAVNAGRELWAPGGLLATLVASWSVALGHLQRGRERAEKLLGSLQKLSQHPGEFEEDEEVMKASQELQSAEAELAQTQAQLDGAQEELDDAEGRLTHIEGGGLVYDFAAERAGTDGYGGRLGIVSSLRRDFDRLDQLLSGYGRQRPTEGGEEANPGDRPEPLPVAERVVLFVDDLDRCEPSRVVEVLQAVHLLLAFPLFSVVVAVDPRWLAWSLEEAYGRRDRIGRVRASPVFSPQDYLEKIFQIPFSLQGMDVDGFGRLVRSVLKQDDDERAPEPTPETGEPSGSQTEDAERAPGNEPSPEPEIPDEEVERVALYPDELREGTAAEVDKPASSEEAMEDKPVEDAPELFEEEREVEKRRDETVKRQEEAKRQRRRFRALAVPEEERKFLIRLHPFLATPRETKRFLNIYRLLRVQAGEVGADYLAYFASEKDGGDHRAVLFLLAFQSGFPNLGPALLKRLHLWWLEAGRTTKVSVEGDGRSQKELFEADDWNKLIDLIASTEDASSADWKRLELDVADVAESVLSDERQRLRRAVDRVKASFDGSSPWPADLFPYAAWAGPVGRFSFGWHLPRSGRGDGERWIRPTRPPREEESVTAAAGTTL